MSAETPPLPPGIANALRVLEHALTDLTTAAAETPDDEPRMEAALARAQSAQQAMESMVDQERQARGPFEPEVIALSLAVNERSVTLWHAVLPTLEALDRKAEKPPSDPPPTAGDATAPPPGRTAEESSPIHSKTDLMELLATTSLSGRAMKVLEIPEDDAVALAIETVASSALDDWRILRSMVDETRRWPVVVTAWSGSVDWQEAIDGEMLLGRASYQHEEGKQIDDVAPLRVLERAAAIDAQAELNERARLQRFRPGALTDEDCIEIATEGCENRFGEAPNPETLRAILTGDTREPRLALERYVARWEDERRDANDDTVPTAHQSWFEPTEPMAILLLPCLHGWAVPAFLPFFGAESSGSPLLIASLRSWQQRFGAELVAHYGTMLQFLVTRPPADFDQALHVAWEHERLAECTTVLPGVALRDHARALLELDRWFLHERP